MKRRGRRFHVLREFRAMPSAWRGRDARLVPRLPFVLSFFRPFVPRVPFVPWATTACPDLPHRPIMAEDQRNAEEATMVKLCRRAFLAVAAMGVASCASLKGEQRRVGRFFFLSQGKTGMMDADGGGLRWFEFDVPNQATWQPCGFFQRRAAGSVSEHGAAAGRAGQAVRRVLPPDADAPLDPRPRQRVAHGDCDAGPAGAVLHAATFAQRRRACWCRWCGTGRASCSA